MLIYLLNVFNEKVIKEKEIMLDIVMIVSIFYPSLIFYQQKK